VSQHDYDLANAAGLAFRSDLNNVLAAIISQNSGATEPTTTFAYQFWADTTTGILKQRNAINSGWVSLLNLSSGKWLGTAAGVTVADAAADTTTWPMLATSQTGEIAPATDAGLTYNASTNTLGASISGDAANLSGGTVAFSAYLPTTAQTIASSTYTKVALSAELFDTNSNFDSTTNYRFTPTVAGYYSISFGAYLQATGITATIALSMLYKNGSAYVRGTQITSPSYGFNVLQSVGSCIVYMNGSTDYLELFAWITGTDPVISFGASSTFMSGCILRP